MNGITKQKRESIENHNVNSIARFEELSDLAPKVIFIIGGDGAGRILFVNDCALSKDDRISVLERVIERLRL